MSANDLRVIDLNADLGEGAGYSSRRDDALLLDVVTSANVACGFHAGDADVMRRTCDEAVARGVTVGAHVSYRDMEGFGRRDVDVPFEQLVEELLEQIGALVAIGDASGVVVRYVKAHGALYNRCAHDREHAAAVVRAVQLAPLPLALLAAPGSVLVRLADAAGVATFTEGFADRAYRADGTLVLRREPHAVHATIEESVAQAIEIVCDGQVTAEHGVRVVLAPRSLCVHGDTPQAFETATAVRCGLLAAGIELRAFL